MGKQVVDKIADLMTAAFGLVAALAWNSAIQDWFASSGLQDSGGPWLYAVVVTVIAVAATIWIGRLSERLTGD